MNPRYRRLPLLLTGLAVLALAAVAIGLVIETAFGSNPKPGFSPPAPYRSPQTPPPHPGTQHHQGRCSYSRTRT